MIRLMDLMLIKMVWSTLKSQENHLSQKTCLSQDNQKAKNCLNPKNWLSQKKNCQKVGIYLISTLKKMGQAF